MIFEIETGYFGSMRKHEISREAPNYEWCIVDICMKQSLLSGKEVYFKRLQAL